MWQVLERLRELDRMDEASGIDNFLNVTCDGKVVPFTEDEDIQAWKLPPKGTVCFDYVSGKKVPVWDPSLLRSTFRSSPFAPPPRL